MQIFNTYTGRKEELRPLEPGVVRMYVCGDTVYDYCHVGHARSKLALSAGIHSRCTLNCMLPTSKL